MLNIWGDLLRSLLHIKTEVKLNFQANSESDIITTGLGSLNIEQNNPSLLWTLPTFLRALKSSMSHCTF